LPAIEEVVFGWDEEYKSMTKVFRIPDSQYKYYEEKFRKKIIWNTAECCELTCGDITHWMPLPKLPRGCR
jgi:hypothetical protein